MADRETKIRLTAVDETTKTLNSIRAGIQDLTGDFGKLSGAFAALGVTGAIAGLGAMVKSAIDSADAMDELSQKTGIAVRQLSALDYAMRREGVSTEAFGKAMKGLSKNLVDAGDASSKAAQIFKTLGVDTSAGPRAALLQLADAFAKLPDGTTKATLATEIFTKVGVDLIPALNNGAAGIRELEEEAAKLGLTFGEDTARAAGEFNDKMFALQESAKKLGITLATEMLPGLNRIVGAMRDAAIEGGILRAAWIGLGGVAAEALGLNDEPIKAMRAELKRLNQEIRDAAPAGKVVQEAVIERNRARIQELEREIKLIEKRNAAIAAEPKPAAKPAAADPRLKALQDQLDRILNGKAAAELAKATAEAEKFQKQLDAVLNRLDSKSAGLDGGFAADLQTLTKAFTSGRLSIFEYQRALALLMAQQPAFKKSLEDEARYLKEIQELNARRAKDLQIIIDEVEKEEWANRTRGLSRSAIEDLTIARMEDRLEAMRGVEGAADEIRALEAQISARMRLRNAIKTGENQEATIRGNTQALQDQARVWDELSTVAASFFLDLVENGRSAFDNLKRWVKQLFADMVALFAKRWVLNMAAGGSVMGSAGNAFAGGVGSDTVAGAAMDFAGGLAGSAIMGTATTWGATAGGAFLQGMQGVGTGVWASGSAGALGSSLAGVYAALASIPVWGWIAMAVIAIGAWIAGSHKGGAKVGGSFFQGGAVPGTDNGRFFTPDQGDAQLETLVNATSQGYVRAVERLGGAAGQFNFGLGFDHDPRGTAQSRVSSMLTDAQGNVIYANLDRSMDDKEVEGALGLESSRLLIAALQSSDLHDELDKYFDGITDIASLSVEQIQQILAGASELWGVIQGLEDLDLKGLDVSALRAWAREGESLTQTFQRVAGQIAAFDDAFLTDAQKFDRALMTVTDGFAALGIAVPTSTQSFYDLVHGLDLSTQAGRDTFEALMRVAPAFLSVQNAAAAMMDSFDELMGRLRPGYTTQRAGLQLSSDISAFQAANPWAAGMSQQAFLEQLRTITREDFAGYSNANQRLILSILGLDETINGNTEAVRESLIAAELSRNARPDSALNQWLAGAPARNGIAEHLSGLLTNGSSPLDPMSRFNVANQEYQRVLGLAQGGNVDAMMKLPSVHQTLIDIARSIWGSSSPFVALFERTFDEVAAVGEVDSYNERMIDLQSDSVGYQAQMATTMGEVRGLLMEIRDKPAAVVTWEPR